MVTDIRLMKQLNFNAVRASHYPNHTRWCERHATMGFHPLRCQGFAGENRFRPARCLTLSWPTQTSSYARAYCHR